MTYFLYYFIYINLVKRLKENHVTEYYRSHCLQIGPYTSEERDLINELKHECSVELINENENNLDSVGCFNSENSWKKLQSFTSLADGKEKGDELSRVSETTRCDERNGAGSIFFVDTDAVVLSVCIKKYQLVVY